MIVRADVKELPAIELPREQKVVFIREGDFPSGHIQVRITAGKVNFNVNDLTACIMKIAIPLNI